MNKKKGEFDISTGFLTEGQDITVYKEYFIMANKRIKSRMNSVKTGREELVKLYHLTDFIIDVIEELDYETLLELNNLHKSFETLRTIQNQEEKQNILTTLNNALNDKINYYRMIYGYTSEKNTLEERINKEKIRTKNLYNRLIELRTKIEEKRKNVRNYFDTSSQFQMLKEYEVLIYNTDMLEELYKFIIDKSNLIFEPSEQDFIELKEVNDFVSVEQIETETLVESKNAIEVSAKSFLQRIRLEQCIKCIQEDKPTM